jgi:hypothetical protein
LKTYEGPCGCDDPVAHDASRHALIDTLEHPERYPVHFADFRMACRGHLDMVNGVKHWYDAIREAIPIPEGSVASFEVQQLTSESHGRIEPDEMPAELAWGSRLLMTALNNDEELFRDFIESEKNLDRKELNKKLAVFLYLAAWAIKSKIQGNVYMVKRHDDDG